MTRCDHCPVPIDRPCLAQVARHPRWCELIDPASAVYDPGHIATLLTYSGAPQPPGPSLIERAVNFAGAVATHVAAGMPAASEELKASRLAICRANTCGFYGENDICRHASCGCFLQVKAGWADQSCPLDPPLWGPLTSEKDEAE